MPEKIQHCETYHTIVQNDTAQIGAILNALWAAGVNLLAFSVSPEGPGTSRLELVASDPDALAQTAVSLGLPLSSRRSGFLLQGENRPGALAAVLNRLAQAGIAITALHAVSSGLEVGALLWVDSAHVDMAAKALENDSPVADTVDEASEESFPASDPPAWSTPARTSTV